MWNKVSWSFFSEFKKDKKKEGEKSVQVYDRLYGVRMYETNGPKRSKKSFEEKCYHMHKI